MLSIYIYTHTLYINICAVYIYIQYKYPNFCSVANGLQPHLSHNWLFKTEVLAHPPGWKSYPGLVVLAGQSWLVDAENLGETRRKSRGIKISWRFSTLSWSSRSKSTWKNRLRWLHYSCQKAETVWHCHAVVQLFACIFIIILIPWLCATHSPVTEKPPPGIPGLFWPAVAGKKTSWEYGSGQRRGTFQDHQQLVPDPQT